MYAELRTAVILQPPTQQNDRRQSLDTSAPAAAEMLAIGDPRVHVGPIPTQGQLALMPTCDDEEDSKCQWWPFCKLRGSECGGSKRKGSCKVFGANGTKQPPSDEEHQRMIRQHTWTDLALKRDCAYNPICEKKAWDCGGTVKRKCSVFGPGGTRAGEAPSDEVLVQAKAMRKRAKQTQRDRTKK